MSISPDLFTAVEPPGVWVTIARPESGEHDNRLVTLRVQPHGARSVTCAREVSRYAPEGSILLAMAQVLISLSTAQAMVTRVELGAIMDDAILRLVEPF